jgi:hypothetical protein
VLAYLCLPAAVRVPHAPGMFVVTDAEAAAIRTVFDQQGELSILQNKCRAGAH